MEQAKACHKAACDKVSVKTILQNMNEAQEALGAEKTHLEASGATELPADHETGKQLIMKAKSTKCELTCMYWIRADKITRQEVRDRLTAEIKELRRSLDVLVGKGAKESGHLQESVHKHIKASLSS